MAQLDFNAKDKCPVPCPNCGGKTFFLNPFRTDLSVTKAIFRICCENCPKIKGDSHNLKGPGYGALSYVYTMTLKGNKKYFEDQINGVDESWDDWGEEEDDWGEKPQAESESEPEEDWDDEEEW